MFNLGGVISERPSGSLKLKIEVIFLPYSSVGFALMWVVEKSGVPELDLESFPIGKPAHTSKVCTAKVLRRHVNSNMGREGKKQCLLWGHGGQLGGCVTCSADHPHQWPGPHPPLVFSSTGDITLPSAKGPAENAFLDFSFQKAHSFPGELSLCSSRIMVLGHFSPRWQFRAGRRGMGSFRKQASQHGVALCS